MGDRFASRYDPPGNVDFIPAISLFRLGRIQMETPDTPVADTLCI
ncbi:MAG: hypothetical protein ABW101_05870 [Candidatus Thiodiazotropha sp.]